MMSMMQGMGMMPGMDGMMPGIGMLPFGVPQGAAGGMPSGVGNQPGVGPGGPGGLSSPAAKLGMLQGGQSNITSPVIQQMVAIAQ